MWRNVNQRIVITPLAKLRGSVWIWDISWRLLDRETKRCQSVPRRCLAQLSCFTPTLFAESAPIRPSTEKAHTQGWRWSLDLHTHIHTSPWWLNVSTSSGVKWCPTHLIKEPLTYYAFNAAVVCSKSALNVKPSLSTSHWWLSEAQNTDTISDMLQCPNH